MTAQIVPPFALELAALVTAAGGKTYAVGGAVRDFFLGKPAKDCDLLVTGIPYEQLAHVFNQFQCDLVGEFQVLKVRVPNSEDVIDVAIPRTEIQTGRGHNDFAVKGDHTLDVGTDMQRRDFTCNSIAFDLVSKQIVDSFGGVQDIQNRILRATGNPVDRFAEDPLRMMRAMRFVAKTGFTIDPDTFAAIKAHSSEIRRVAGERLSSELTGLLACKSASGVLYGLELMRDSGLLAQILPEFEQSIGFVQNNPYHDRTVDAHVFAAVEYAVSRDFSPRVRLAVLLHDIGKPASYKEIEGRGTFHGHEDISAEMARSAMIRLKFPTAETDAICKIVAEHLRPANNEDRTLRRFMALMGELTSEAIDCREADWAAHAPHVAISARVRCDDFRARMATLPVAVRGFTAADLALKGGALMAPPFSLKGKAIGDAKTKLASAVVDGLVPNEPDALAKFLLDNPRDLA